LREYGVITTTALSKAPENLVQWSFLERVEDSEFRYRIKVKLVRYWLTKSYPLRQAIWELKDADLEAEKLFELATEVSEHRNLPLSNLYETILELNPNHFPALFKLAEVYFDLKNFEKLRDIYKRAYEVDPSREQEEYYAELNSLLINYSPLPLSNYSPLPLSKHSMSKSIAIAIIISSFLTVIISAITNSINFNIIINSQIFPKSSCGDSYLRPSNLNNYSVSFYPVYVEYSKSNLEIIKTNFCQDAYVIKEENKENKLVIQVASFTSKKRANLFADLLSTRIGKAEVGEPKIISFP